MKRMHVHVNVRDLAASIEFYSTLFDLPPTVKKTDYAKWMLDDPRLNFAISAHDRSPGVDHLGIEAETEAELSGVHALLEKASGPVLDEGDVTCCYAQSTKKWIKDPQDVPWETFLTHGASAVYGHDFRDAPPATDGKCC